MPMIAPTRAPDYVGHMWFKSRAGLADYDGLRGGVLVSGCIVEPEDWLRFPVLGVVFAVVVWENSDGFVGHRLMDEIEYRAWVESCEQAPIDRLEYSMY